MSLISDQKTDADGLLAGEFKGIPSRREQPNQRLRIHTFACACVQRVYTHTCTHGHACVHVAVTCARTCTRAHALPAHAHPCGADPGRGRQRAAELRRDARGPPQAARTPPRPPIRPCVHVCTRVSTSVRGRLYAARVSIRKLCARAYL